MGFPGGSVVNRSTNAGDVGLIPGSGRLPREGNDNPLQYSCLGNHMGRGAWRATVRGVTESDVTQQLNSNKINNKLGATPQVLPPVKTISFNHAAVCFLFIGFYVSALELLSTSYSECHNIVCIYMFHFMFKSWVVSGNR